MNHLLFVHASGRLPLNPATFSVRYARYRFTSPAPAPFLDSVYALTRFFNVTRLNLKSPLALSVATSGSLTKALWINRR